MTRQASPVDGGLKERTRAAKDAANNLAELYVFAAVAEILSGSTAPRSGTGQRAADRILKICATEQQRRLAAHDVAIRRATLTGDTGA